MPTLTRWEPILLHQQRMTATRQRLIEQIAHRAAVPLLAGLAYFALAGITISLTHSNHNISAIWPANAVLVSFMMTRPRAQWGPIIMAGFIGNGLANLVTRDALAAPLLFGIANMVEILILTTALERRKAKQFGQRGPGALLHFMFWAGLVAPAMSGVLGALTARLVFGAPLHVAFLRWYTADALGLLIFVPVFAALNSGDFVRFLHEQSWARRLEAALLQLLTALLSYAVFYVARYPAVFLLIIPLMLVIFRAGAFHTKMALMIIAIVGSVATLSGVGPIPRVAHDPDIQVYLLQVVIAAFLLIEIPITATLKARDELITRLRESEQSLRLFASQSPILLLSFDLQGICQRVVGTTELLLNRDPTTLVGRSFADISEEGQLELKGAHNDALDYLDHSHTAEFRAVRLGDRWLEAIFRANFDETGRCIGTLATIHDVTERKNQALSLSRSAKTDSLTGLLNRAGFNARLEQALQRAAPGTVSLALIDVDRFKQINDQHGHLVGDLVLKEIARRISREVRSTDAVGRLGGDEFIILIATPNWNTAQEVCRRVVEAVSGDVVTLPSGKSLCTAISCGVARLQANQSAEAFIHAADVALYEAKRGGRNQVIAA